MHLLALPNELLLDIASYLPEISDFVALCKVNRLLSKVGRAEMYKQVEVPADQAILRSLVRTLVFRPELATQIKVLRLLSGGTVLEQERTQPVPLSGETQEVAARIREAVRDAHLPDDSLPSEASTERWLARLNNSNSFEDQIDGYAALLLSLATGVKELELRLPLNLYSSVNGIAEAVLLRQSVCRQKFNNLESIKLDITSRNWPYAMTDIAWLLLPQLRRIQKSDISLPGRHPPSQELNRVPEIGAQRMHPSMKSVNLQVSKDIPKIAELLCRFRYAKDLSLKLDGEFSSMSDYRSVCAAIRGMRKTLRHLNLDLFPVCKGHNFPVHPPGFGSLQSFSCLETLNINCGTLFGMADGLIQDFEMLPNLLPPQLAKLTLNEYFYYVGEMDTQLKALLRSVKAGLFSNLVQIELYDADDPFDEEAHTRLQSQHDKMVALKSEFEQTKAKLIVELW